MANLGSGENGELTFLDVLAIASFVISLQNLDLNINQTDLQKETQKIDNFVNDRINDVLTEIHEHLERQDRLLSDIQMELMERGN